MPASASLTISAAATVCASATSRSRLRLAELRFRLRDVRLLLDRLGREFGDVDGREQLVGLDHAPDVDDRRLPAGQLHVGLDRGGVGCDGLHVAGEFRDDGGRFERHDARGLLDAPLHQLPRRFRDLHKRRPGGRRHRPARASGTGCNRATRTRRPAATTRIAETPGGRARDSLPEGISAAKPEPRRASGVFTP